MASDPKYFPVSSGRYEVVPGLFPFGKDFGNGAADQKIFQIDSTFERYRLNKLKCREEGIDKYFLAKNFSPECEGLVVRFMAERLVKEYPEEFSLKQDPKRGWVFLSKLTEEGFTFDDRFALLSQRPLGLNPYRGAFDAVVSQVPEDVAVWRWDRREECQMGRNWLAAVHLSAASHWSPAAKVGRDFVEVHQPVAGIDKILKAEKGMLEAMVDKGPFVRFAWGVNTDNRLNHHPLPPPGENSDLWKGRSFDGKDPQLYLRVERQTLWSFSEQGASLFTIRTYFENCATLSAEKRNLLRLALLSMTEEQKLYKRVTVNFDGILDWLAQG